MELAELRPAQRSPAPLLLAHLNMILFFGADIQTGPRNALRFRDVASSIVSNERAARIILGWPESFFRWFEEQGPSRSDEVSLSTGFGHVLDKIRGTFDAEDGEFLRAELRRYLANQWSGGLIQERSVWYQPPSHERWVTYLKAAKRIKAPVTKLDNLLATGKIAGKQRQAKIRRMVLLDPSEIRRARRHLSNILNIKEAAAVLGIPRRCMLELSDAGHIPVERAVATGRREYRMTHLRAFIRRLQRLTSSGEGKDATPLTSISLRHISLSLLLGSIFLGDLAVFSLKETSGKLSRFGVMKDKIYSGMIGGGDRQARYTLRRAARACAVNPRQIHAMCQAGLLPVISNVRYRRYNIPESAITCFKNDFRTAHDIATVLQTTPRHAHRKMIQLGIQPALNSNSVTGISAVWWAKDVPDFGPGPHFPTSKAPSRPLT